MNERMDGSFVARTSVRKNNESLHMLFASIVFPHICFDLGMHLKRKGEKIPIG